MLNIPATFDSHTGLCCSISPRSLLGAVHWLWGSLSGLRLYRLRPVPHGAVLDPEQRAHPVRGDSGGAARHPVLCWSQCGQDGYHQPRRNILQGHEPVNSYAPVSFYSTVRLLDMSLGHDSSVWCLHMWWSQCNKTCGKNIRSAVFCF